jgi:hypothetical protein
MTCLSNEAHAPQIVLPRLAQLRFCSLSATGFFTTRTLMKTLRVITPMAVRALTAAAAGLSLGCVGRADAPPQSPPASDYDVYAVILREQFINPPQDDHGDGLISECRDGPPVGQIQIAGETQFRRQGGGSRDSAAAAELPPDAAPLVATLRAMDGLPPRTLAADSFSVGMPVRLVAPAPESRDTGTGPLPVTLSRVAYSADSTWALVHAVQPCRHGFAQEDAPPPGTAVLAALQRQSGSWVVSRAVALYVE